MMQMDIMNVQQLFHCHNRTIIEIHKHFLENNNWGVAQGCAFNVTAS